MRHLQSVLCISLVLASVALGNTQPEVTNVMAVQRPHTALVDVTFDLFDADGDLLHVTLWYSLDGGGSWDHQCMTVWGDVGQGIAPGEGLVATWDAGVDISDFESHQFTIRVYVDDGSGNGEVPDGFVYIPPGTFMMGSPEGEPERESWEGPQHQVTLSQGFFMSQYEVTEQWWAEVMNETPSTSQLPKRYVSWDMAVEFCNALSIQQSLTPAYTIHGPDGDVTWNQSANGYRLPTEAEWEYACRAGSASAFANGPITHTGCSPLDPNLDAMGWYCGNSGDQCQPVAQKQANAWGLYDMHGNVWEWTWCGWRRVYTTDDVVDPLHNVAPGAGRMIRGGVWFGGAASSRSGARFLGSPPSYPYSSYGFRPVRTAFENP